MAAQSRVLAAVLAAAVAATALAWRSEEFRRYFPAVARRLEAPAQEDTERRKRFQRPVSFHVWAWAASCSTSVGYLWRERMYAGVSASLLAAGGFRSRDIDAAEAAFVLTDTVAVPRPVPANSLDRFIAFFIPEDSTLGRGLATVARSVAGEVASWPGTYSFLPPTDRYHVTLFHLSQLEDPKLGAVLLDQH